jgi:hypothetical protein
MQVCRKKHVGVTRQVNQRPAQFSLAINWPQGQ